MLGLVQVTRKPVDDTPLPRLWLVFFSDGEGTAWWSRLLRPGFRHVEAAAWFAEQERWVWINPTWRGTAVTLYREREFDARLGHLVTQAAAVLRARSRFARGTTPAAWHCVGAIKALLGLKSCALTPYGLFRHLLDDGAEPVEVPGGKPIQTATTAAGRPGHWADAGARSGARRSGTHQGDAAAIGAGNAAV